METVETKQNKFFRVFQNLKERLFVKWNAVKEVVSHANWKTSLSFAFMGVGQLCYKKWIKGIIYFIIQILALLYFIFKGAQDFIGLFTLGSVKANPWYGVKGDNSIIMLILGILSVIFIILYICVYISNVKDAYTTQLRVEAQEKPLSFKDEIKELLNSKFHITTLFLPVLGVAIFNILPIIFMILMAFTNYGGSIADNNDLVDWVGLDNFFKLVSLVDISGTFFRILGWNLLWAILSTFINYFAGLGLALLLNRKCVKGKVFWRAFPIIAYAVPGFITLLGFKFMFSYGGPINSMIVSNGGTAIGFLDLDAKWTARLIGLLVNAWISIPSSMLLATGILSNMRTDLYEAASLHGAKPFQQFTHITLPYVLFATTPVLITQFTGNFNNFGIFYFLRGGLYLDGYFNASDTDLLINWLYNLSIDNNYYSIGAAISLVIFIITSLISLAVYVASPSYKQEDTYK
ncbi:MAG: sugar ABC transporter permease [Roseburia sp.]|nr:sugar ABC transporter permease [Anaeroplasma bactoclasticum]MCM1196063.1 sugar ABC transporter permease [Roseburia sp.]MCM1557412.1 sugar ABC transporter permease [Anaeroplasma bactoclasticum]